MNTDSGKLVKSVHAKTGIGVHGKTSMGVHGRPESVFTLGRNMHLLDTLEYENLRYLQKQRHLSAHPVLNKERELHSPNKETVRSLLRNTLEDLLVKPPFYTQHIMKEILVDLAESSSVLNTREKVKKYVVSRYLGRTTESVELNIFRSVWKIVFKLENDECNENRLINLNLIEVLASRNSAKLVEEINGDKDFYSNIASAGEPLSYLIYFLSKQSDLYPILNEDARLKIQHCIESDAVGRTMGWFIKDNLNSHADDIETWVRGEDHPTFKPSQFDALLDMADSDEWQEKFCKIVSVYYGCSSSYDQADSRFQSAIPKYIELFNREALMFLASQIEGNSQCYVRAQARHDYTVIKERIDAVFVDEFQYQDYPRFSSKLGLGD